MSGIEHPSRIKVCAHPNGEGVWWDADRNLHKGCIQDCDCAPTLYMRADVYRGAVEENERLRAALREIIGDLSVPSRPPAWAAHALQVAQAVVPSRGRGEATGGK